ncbi:unnamed protein product [Ophioblennius macclurei]
MEGAWHRRRCPKKAHVASMVFFMCVFANVLSQENSTRQCPQGDYLNEQRGICCNKCPPGFKLEKKCLTEEHRSICKKCPEGQYMNSINYAPNCRLCKRCKDAKNEYEVSPCKKDRDTICRCKDGFYKFYVDSETYECRNCLRCKPEERERHMCTPTNNTVCDCKENYYRVNKRCEPCEKCTADCHLHCDLVRFTKAPHPPNSISDLAIAGIAAGLVFFIGAAVFITHKSTQYVTQRRLNHSVSQQANDSTSGACEQVLIHSEEPLQTTAATLHNPSDPEASNLPDCVPLEIRISELIYAVLDRVSARQVKQLVRSLGVSEIEIEEAEHDHRSSREAHYQMLRVWAERGLRTGEGSLAGGMLHRPLFEELLDKMRQMHLGHAAEQLELKFDIQ